MTEEFERVELSKVEDFFPYFQKDTTKNNKSNY